LFRASTHSFVGADLSALCKEAANVAVTRIFNELGQRMAEAKAQEAAAAETTQEAQTVVDSADSVVEAEYVLNHGMREHEGAYHHFETNLRRSDSMDIASTPDQGASSAALVKTRPLSLLEMKKHHQEKRRRTAYVGVLRCRSCGYVLTCAFFFSDALREIGTLTPEALEPLAIAMEDFDEAIKRVQPSAKREGYTSTALCFSLVFSES
jgi:SpoVK/Ycf46/Vps4 family AAA+-type ATPase